MRWQDLLADVEAQAEALQRLETEAEAAERARTESGAVRWAQRWGAARGAEVTCHLSSGAQVRGRVLDAGEDWVLLASDPGQVSEILVPLAAIEAVSGLGPFAAPAEASPIAVDLRWLLRRTARDRAAVAIATTSGAVWTGVVGRVAADHLDLALGDGTAGATGRVTVPVSAVVSVARR
jgi:hypothetical protein